MLVHLTKIMDKFDLDDFQETKEPNFVHFSKKLIMPLK
ncbi:putative toxic anion resistance domain protein [Clostridioides difficile DA00165]|nr:putative toxic anion resistance domain protein [Clostridioides difficile DA00165]